MAMITCRVDPNRCTGCGTCVGVCPQGAASLRDGVASIDASLCRGCGVCIEECPAGAISLETPVPALPAWVKPEPPAPRAEPYVPLPVSRHTEVVVPQPHSVLTRLAGALVPSALSLAAALGEAWLNRLAGGSASSFPPSGVGQPSAPLRRRLRRRGRG